MTAPQDDEDATTDPKVRGRCACCKTRLRVGSSPACRLRYAYSEDEDAHGNRLLYCKSCTEQLYQAG